MIRDDIATAANTVDGIKCTPYYRQIAGQGEACVRLDQINRDDSGFGYMTTWQVWIALHQDLAIAEKFVEQITSALISALSPTLLITTITPQLLQLDQGVANGVIFEGIGANSYE